jgi:hypothetical protein
MAVLLGENVGGVDDEMTISHVDAEHREPGIP